MRYVYAPPGDRKAEDSEYTAVRALGCACGLNKLEIKILLLFYVIIEN